MQILIFTLVIIALIVFGIYKIKKTFSKLEIIGFFSLIVMIIIGIIYTNHLDENKLPDTFKSNYLKEKNIEILKLSYNQKNFEVLSSSKAVYDFTYIIKKQEKEYVCEAKDVVIILIEDEYVIKKYKEECREK